MPFDEEVETQYAKNVARWGHQDLPTLIIASGEEFGELCKAFLGNAEEDHDVMKEAVHLAALLHEIWDVSLEMEYRKEVIE